MVASMLVVERVSKSGASYMTSTGVMIKCYITNILNDILILLCVILAVVFSPYLSL